MRVALIMPRGKLGHGDALRALEATQRRFLRKSPDLSLMVYVHQDFLDHYEPLLAGALIHPCGEDLSVVPADVVVFVLVNEWPELVVSRQEGQRIYKFHSESHGRGGRGPFELVWPETYDRFENPYVDSHLFNRLSGRQWGFVNFPYGCLYMDSESGPVDPFGFRIDHDWRQWRNRPDDLKLVVSFGGSAAFSCFCAFEEMFTSRLEVVLNERMQAAQSATRYKVLNFGMHDNVVMQEMLTYMLHVWSIRPDFVIAHDGHNDLWYGLTDDPFLVNQYDIIYQRHSEQWSKKIHDTESLASPPIVSCATDGIEFNLPQRVIEAYVTRKRQFMEVAEARGAKFLWGLQPLITSKGKRSPLEQTLQVPHGTTSEALFFKRLFQAYEMLAETLNGLPEIRLVDFNAHFKTFGAESELMWDHVHCSPLGDDVIARHYADAILAAG